VNRPHPLLAAALAVAWLALFGLTGCSESHGDVLSETEIATVARRDLSRSVIATGIVRPKVGAEVRVGSRVSGIVERLHVNIGDRVERGDLLAELDASGLDARLRQASAARQNAEASLGLALREEARLRTLFADQLLPEQELDRAVATRTLAEASLEEATAALDVARIERSYSTIRAPIQGVVASVSTQEGETVAASFASPTFVTIIDLDRLEVWAYVDETDIGRIEIGQRASFTVDTYPDAELRGTVCAIQPAAEVRDNVVNYIARIEIDDDLGRTLRPEMTTTVEVELDTREGVLAIPNGAIRRENGRKFVYLVEGPVEDRLPRRRSIETGWRTATHTEILEGLDEGQRVLLTDPPPDS